MDFCENYFEKCTNYNIYLNPKDSGIPQHITTEEPDIPRVDNLNSRAAMTAECLETCMKWPRGIDPSAGLPEGSIVAHFGEDTFWCREHHLSLIPSAAARNEAAFHCPHVTNNSLGVCKDTLVNGFTPFELLRDGEDTNHRYIYCDIAGAGTVADCSKGGVNDDNLDTALKLLPSTVEVLFLNGNAITTLGKSAFYGSDYKFSNSNNKNLKALYLSDNPNLSSIDKDALEGLDNLLSFNAANNQITFLDENFLKHTPKLTQFSTYFNFDLFASTNKLPVKFFSHTPDLERMSLYGTGITTFDAGTFDGLSKLLFMSFVNNEKINEDSFPAGLFDPCVSLLEWDFFGNSITELREGLFGDWANNILRVALFNNPIEFIHEKAGLENLHSIEMAFFHETHGTELFPSQATFDIIPVAEKLTAINPDVIITYGSTCMGPNPDCSESVSSKPSASVSLLSLIIITPRTTI